MPNNVTKGAFTHARDAFVLVPSDTNTVDIDTTNNPIGYKYCDIMVSVGGTLKVQMADGLTGAPATAGSIVTLTVPAGVRLGILVKQVFATGTAATGIVGFVGRDFQ